MQARSRNVLMAALFVGSIAQVAGCARNDAVVGAGGEREAGAEGKADAWDAPTPAFDTNLADLRLDFRRATAFGPVDILVNRQPPQPPAEFAFRADLGGH